ncbi:LacI family DNA-binding transcriptional regulator [Coralloluteibacterium stylophorae]|uniref:LacI family DNA-binding transcriptional regulator n=1 Tax=Coralloluteibacterium stylophorae TaxID=1776034 RepID=A0AAP2C892_9GAMM|nr:LacI family DNA-binding transcriptional regulator [Coralloluteibacterium stylophorae]MBS7456161.1 LacI family DNA-binding transcriptional regulator [Coralloluteibacterium stylophorae]
MTATIKDVAREANVSVASVSRALNGRGNMSDATRARVLKAAQRLDYAPNGMARSLITRRTHTVGALLPELYGEFFSELIRGLDLAARAHGLHLMVSSSHGNAAEAAAAIRALHGRVDGLLLMSPYADAAFLGTHLRAGLPTVVMNTQCADERVPSFSVDNYGGAQAVVRHLIGLGHRRIAHIAGPQDNFEAAERLRGYRDALAELAPDQEPEVLPGGFTEESGHRAGQAIAAMARRPDAVFAGNDSMAIGCLFALAAAGLRVPVDIALAGFDDIPISRFVNPPLTTCRVRIADLGRHAMDRLIAVVTESTVAEVETHTVSPELVVRASCGAGSASTR